MRRTSPSWCMQGTPLDDGSTPHPCWEYPQNGWSSTKMQNGDTHTLCSSSGKERRIVLTISMRVTHWKSRVDTNQHSVNYCQLPTDFLIRETTQLAPNYSSQNPIPLSSQVPWHHISRERGFPSHHSSSHNSHIPSANRSTPGRELDDSAATFQQDMSRQQNFDYFLEGRLGWLCTNKKCHQNTKYFC